MKWQEIEEYQAKIDRFISYLENVRHAGNSNYWIKELKDIRDFLEKPWILEKTVIDLTQKGKDNGKT